MILNSSSVKLSDLRNKKGEKKWSSESVVLQDEPGDAFYNDEKSRDDFLQKEFEKEQHLKKMDKARKANLHPL